MQHLNYSVNYVQCLSHCISLESWSSPESSLGSSVGGIGWGEGDPTSCSVIQVHSEKHKQDGNGSAVSPKG